MSVYTEVTHDQLVTFLNDYAIGELVSYEGIGEGIENTNYFVNTEQGQFVLTLFEQYEFNELGYFLDVMLFFYQHDIPSADPVADKNGHYLKTLCGRPAALVTCLLGQGVDDLATLAQCEAIGDVLGKMHIAGKEFSQHRVTQRGSQWRKESAVKLLPLLDNNATELLKNELIFQADYANIDIPFGVTHSDLFRDNALFKGDELQGVIDFYYACDEYLLYDLAVAVNDWCVDEKGLIEHKRYQALMQAYLQHRELTEAEQIGWNLMLRAAALRFWLSRLQDTHFPREGELTQTKNPDAFLKILKQHRANENKTNLA